MKRFWAILFFVLFGSGPAVAVTLSFDALARGPNATPISLPGVVISETSGGALFVYGTGDFGMPVGGGVCGLQSDFSCTGDVSLLFIGPVSNLKFKGFYASASDAATISAYSNGALVSYAVISGSAAQSEIDIDLSNASGITQVLISDRSSASSRGIAYGSFSYDIDPPIGPGPIIDPPAVLVFDVFASGNNGPVLDIGPAILTGLNGTNLFVYRTGDFGIAQNGGFCALDTLFRCMGSFTLEFKQAITNLTFGGFFAKVTDSAIVSLFDGQVLIFTGTFFGSSSGTIRFDFSQFARLTSILIQDSSNPATKGIAYGDFKFRYWQPPVIDPPVVEPPIVVAPVPLPATWLLTLLALVLLTGLKQVLDRRAQPVAAMERRGLPRGGKT